MVWGPEGPFNASLQGTGAIPQFKTTAKLGNFLETRFKQSFLNRPKLPTTKTQKTPGKADLGV